MSGISLYKNMMIFPGGDAEIIKKGYMVTKGSRIMYVGDSLPEAIDSIQPVNADQLGSAEGQAVSKTDKQVEFDETIDLKDKLVMPGFVNAHSHLPMTLMRGYGENMPLNEWLFDRIFPFEDHLTNEATYAGTMIGLAEMLQYGTVSFSDSYFFLKGMLDAVGEVGVKVNASRSMSVVKGKKFEDYPSFGEFKDLYEEFVIEGAKKFDHRILLDAAPHAEYTTDEYCVQSIAKMAKEYGIRIQIHMSETTREHEECKVRHGGMTPAEYFLKLGVFDVPCVAAHCTYAEDKDIKIMKEKGVIMAHNPSSNLKLGSGIAYLRDFISHGVCIAIGTDSVASNNSLNMAKEMTIASLLAKGVERDPTLVDNRFILNAATINGFKAQGRSDCGRLIAGNKADFIVIDTDKPQYFPCHDIFANLVFSMQGSDVWMTVVDGKVLYKNGEFATIDIEKAQYDVKKQTKKILSEL